MRLRRIVAAAISAVALLAVNVGVAETAQAGSSWTVIDKDGGKNQTRGSSWT